MRIEAQPQRRIAGFHVRITGVAMVVAVVLSSALLGAESQGQTFTVLYSFHGETDGMFPVDGVTLDPAGNLYSTTSEGGISDNGLVFALDGMGRQTVLYRFTGGSDGGSPQASVVRGAGGSLYGTASAGGDLNCMPPAGCGTVFKLSKGGKFTLLHTFTGAADGGLPFGGLIGDGSGNLYGSAYVGGDLNSCPPVGCGVLFKLDRTGRQTILHTFTGSDGTSPPYGTLLLDKTGVLYGSASGGGKNGFGCIGGCGVVFKVDKNNKETTLYTFPGGVRGANPLASLIRDGSANIYGVTRRGGDFACEPKRGCGTVFKLSKSGKETTLYRFKGGPDGRYPNPGLVRDSSGNLYGTAANGGDSSCFQGCGTVFKLNTTGQFTVLHSFTAGTDGANPFAGLIRDARGNLYGTTLSGGDLGCGGGGCGVVFEITPR